MKIALVSHAADTHSGSRAPIELAKRFVKLGHQVYFYAYFDLSNHKAKKEIESQGINLILIKSPKIQIIGRFIGALKLISSLKKIKPDIISAHTTLPFMLGSKLSGIPIFSTYHGTQQDVWFDRIFPRTPGILDKTTNYFLNIFIKSVMWLQLILSDKIITLSKYCSHELLSLYGKKAPFVFWGGAPPHLLNIRRKLKKSNSINLLSVSRIVPYKNFHILINIVKDLNHQYKNLKLTIIGSHPDKKYLSYLKKIKPSNVKIIADATDSILASHYQKADIYITCDKFLFFGEPVLEAAEFGKPTIAFDFASAKEIVKNNHTGYVVKNEEESKKAFENLIKSPEKRATFGRNAQKFAKHFTWDRCANNYLKLFEIWQKH